MNYRELKRLSLVAFIGFLILTALIAIVSVLTGKFGELQWKILLTTFTISAASICSMCCAAFMEKRKQVPLGLAGIVLSIITAVLVIAGMWPELDIEEYWKTTVTCGVLALGFAHSFLLTLPDLDPRHKWVQVISPIFIGVLAAQIIIAIWGEIDNDWYYRFLALVAIVTGLETLVIPILTKLRKPGGAQKGKLILSPIEGDLYRDPGGKTYRVTEIKTEMSSI
jgi:hypothetical protein